MTPEPAPLPERPADPVARAGTIWVCIMCGKTARHRWDGGLDRGWDESCALHAHLCRDDGTLKRTRPGGRVVQAEPAPPAGEGA